METLSRVCGLCVVAVAATVLWASPAYAVDCNNNSIEDAEEIAANPYLDCDSDGVLDSCESVGADCNGNGFLDSCELAAAAGNGLVGQYFLASGGGIGGLTYAQVFDMSRFKGARVDPNINFDKDNVPFWQQPFFPSDDFGTDTAVRWTGYITAPATGTYTFYINANDRARLTVNGTVLNTNFNWVGSPCCTEMAAAQTIALTAGVKYSFQFDYGDAGNDTNVYLMWYSADGGVAKDFVPTSAFVPALDANSDGVLDACNTDCNNNSIVDLYEIAQGTATDCNSNYLPDSCDVTAPPVDYGQAYWRFSTLVANTVEDEGPNNLDGTTNGRPSLSGDVPVNPVPQNGFGNTQSLNLNWLNVTTGGYFSVPDTGGNLTMGDTSFTIEAWVKLTAVSPGSPGTDDRQWLCQKKVTNGGDSVLDYSVLVQRGNNSPTTNYGASPSSGRQLQVVFGSGSVIWGVTSNLQITTANTWHYVAVSHDAAANSVRFVLNDQSETLTFTSGHPSHSTNSGPLVVGAHTSTSSVYAQFVRGLIDEMRVSRGVVPMNRLLKATASYSQDQNSNGIPDECEAAYGGGACCKAGNVCVMKSTAAGCTGAGGISFHPNEDCNDNPPPCGALVEGSCCYDDGTCAVTTLPNCTGNWTEGGSCVPNVCPQPGECCAADGACNVTLEADCTGAWTEGGDCDPNPCPQPAACCKPDATCAIMLESACTALGGVFHVGQTCTTGLCLDCNTNGILDDVEISSHGLIGYYYNNQTWTAPYAVARIDAQVNFPNPFIPPAPLGNDHFSVRWIGSLLSTAAAGTYTLIVEHDDGFRLYLNGTLLMSSGGSGTDSKTVTLAADTKYHLRLDYFEDGGGQACIFRWIPPGGSEVVVPSSNLLASFDSDSNGVPDECEYLDCNNNFTPDNLDISSGNSKDCDLNGVPDECQLEGNDCNGNGLLDSCELALVGSNGLVAQYWSSQNDGDFTTRLLVQVDPNINFDGGWPPAGVPEDKFAARWTGWITTPAVAGTYTFYTITDDGERLWVNGTLLIDQWHGDSGTEYSGTISLAANTSYTVRMDFYEGGGGQKAILKWLVPGGTQEVVPGSVLNPAKDANSDSILDDCQDPVGACCFANGSCDEMTASQCAGLTGTYQGDGTDCIPNPCSQPTGACCQPNGSCSITTEAQCAGVWQGAGTGCNPNPCPQPRGACCDDQTGNCADNVEADNCLPPLRFGANTLCANLNPPCSPPVQIGACCDEQTGNCLDNVESTDCLPPLRFGANTLCANLNPPCFDTTDCNGNGVYDVIELSPAYLNQHGLIAQYFNNETLTAPPIVTRLDLNVDHDNHSGWPTSGPEQIPGFPYGDHFSVRWTGWLTSTPGVYQFRLEFDNGVRLRVNGSLVINDWPRNDPPSSRESGDITLSSLNTLKLEFREGGGGQECQLYWRPQGGGSWTIIPSSALYAARDDNSNGIPDDCEVPQPVFGACCDEQTSNCLDNVESTDCLPPLRFGANTLCANLNPPCSPPVETGACCDEQTGNCLDNVEETNCLPPLRFAANTLCANLNPPCSPPVEIGACCDEQTGNCLDNVEETNCLPPLRFGANTLCADLNPPCAPVGACCNGDNCQVFTEAACTGGGGTYRGDGTDCDPNPCCALLGDLDHNGLVDGRDIQGFVNCFMGTGANCACGDFNLNGAVDEPDVGQFVTVLLAG